MKISAKYFGLVVGP